MADMGRGARWFAAEFFVVVTGVLVALALQAFYERGQDGRRERAYLRQLATELRASEAIMVTADSFTADADRAGVMLLRTFRAPAPRDSMLVWLNLVGRWAFHLPAIGTAEALVASGDLRLIRNDSLRAAIADYVGRHRPILQTLQSATEKWQTSRGALARLVDLNEAALLFPDHASPKMRDTLYSPLPRRSRSGFAIDTDALLRDRAVYAALDEMNSAKYVSYLMRTQIRQRARALREQVEAEAAR